MPIIATITSQFDASSYRTIVVPRVATYSVESALDTDADSWAFDVSHYNPELIAMLKRDAEVRVALRSGGFGRSSVDLQTGFADSIGLTQDGILSLEGRDLSSVAVDSTHLPWSYYKLTAKQVIEQEARELGFHKVNVDTMPGTNHIFTDGSENYWAFWYRLVRHHKKWIWCDPDGTLNVTELTNSDTPNYWFGEPSPDWPDASQYIRVGEVEYRKDTRGRIGVVFVYWESGQNSGHESAADQTISDWIKRPKKVVPGESAHTNKYRAMLESFEEIYESKVGAIEIVIRTADPGYEVRQNKIAYVNLPDLDIRGQFFIVGVRTIGGADGYQLEVRLREKGYALTRRDPRDPEVSTSTDTPTGSGAATTTLGSQDIPHPDCFVNAALEFSKPHTEWEFDIILAMLLATGFVETGGSFANVAEERHIEWHPFNPDFDKNIEAWYEAFANSAGNPNSPSDIRSREQGVGTMQLTDLGLKELADRWGGKSGEYDGGRWDYCTNVRVGAKYLIDLLNQCGIKPNDANTTNGGGVCKALAAYQSGNCDNVSPTELRNRCNKFIEYYKQLTQVGADKPITSSNYADIIVKTALSLVGKGYSQQNRTGPDTFDCSGLSWYCYNAAKLGSEIGGLGTTYTYWGNSGGLVAVTNKGDLRPSDMVFFDNHIDAKPGHMGIYIGDGQMVSAVGVASGVKRDSIEDIPGIRTYMGARRLPLVWNSEPAPPDNKGSNRIMVQGGHVPPMQPGFETETGAPGIGIISEEEFNLSLRDALVGLLNSDNRFDVTSVGGLITPDNWQGDIFFAIHCDGSNSPATNGFSFGYPDATAGASQALRDSILNEWVKIAGHPVRGPADNYTADEHGYYGFSHTNATAELLMEHGFVSNTADSLWLKNHVQAVAQSHYSGICRYLKITPLGG